MTKTALKRTEPGRYYATNGRALLDPQYVSATVVRVGKSWLTTYSIAWTAEISVTDELLEDARVGVAAALSEDAVNPSALRSAHTSAVAAAITAACADARNAR